MAFFDLNESLEMRLKSWSHSRLMVGEKCARWAELKYIQNIPEPERPLPPGKTEHPNDRGTRLHTAAEMFIRGGIELIPELNKFDTEFLRARDLFSQGKLSLEGEWAFTRSWEPVAWMSSDVWCRIKADMVAFMTEDTAIVVDYKSGKRYGNEIKHGEQMRLYVIAVLLKYPHIKSVRSELWYLDQDELTGMTYTRDQGLRFVEGFERRGEAFTSMEVFDPKPSTFNCKWCPYKPVKKGGTGHCPVGV